MRMFGIAALALPVAIAACAPKPAPVPVPVMSPAEEACSALVLQTAGVTEGDVTISPVSSTKTGATLYVASFGGVDYNCVVEVDNTISSFGPA